MISQKRIFIKQTRAEININKIITGERILPNNLNKLRVLKKDFKLKNLFHNFFFFFEFSLT